MFIPVALNAELHKVFWTVPCSAIDTGEGAESKASFKIINFWRKHQIMNCFISTHAAEEQWETAAARNSPAPARSYYRTSQVLDTTPAESICITPVPEAFNIAVQGRLSYPACGGHSLQNKEPI